MISKFEKFQDFTRFLKLIKLLISLINKQKILHIGAGCKLIVLFFEHYIHDYLKYLSLNMRVRFPSCLLVFVPLFFTFPD